MIRKLTEAECRQAIQDGDFAPDVRGAAPLTAIVLTQSWCPQWRYLAGYLEKMDAELNVGAKPGGGTAAAAAPGAAVDTKPKAAILTLEYDRERFYEDFLAFKERVLGNHEVPYVRYYRNGALVGESNFISAQGFKSKLTGE
jgi:hypothetical protein